MKKLALVALLAAAAGLTACTTFNPHRRTMTGWSVDLLKESPDPCGSFQKPTRAPCSGTDTVGRRVIDSVFVKPITFMMVPIGWLTDTFILNPIDGWKKAELETHERRHCKAENPNWSDARADHHAYGVHPSVTPWPISYILTAPEFTARWIWNSTTPTDPVDDEAYQQYWREHNESTGE